MCKGRKENSAPLDDCLSSLRKPRDAQRRSSGRIFYPTLTLMMDSYILYLSVLSSDKHCKYYGPRAGSIERRARNPNCFPLWWHIVLLKGSFLKIDFENKSADYKGHKIFPSLQRVNRSRSSTISIYVILIRNGVTRFTYKTKVVLDNDSLKTPRYIVTKWIRKFDVSLLVWNG